MALEGKWYNDLHSVMELQVEGSRVTGTYRTAVSEGPLPPPALLVGQTDPAPQSGEPQSIAFVVAWPHSGRELGSATAWSGALRQVKDDAGRVIEEVIVAHWLLTTETKEEWVSTTIGEDVFHRSPPSDAQVRFARSLRQRPTPAERK